MQGKIASTARGWLVGLALVFGALGVVPAPVWAAPRARPAPKVSVKGVQKRVVKLRGALVGKKGRAFDMGAFLKGQGVRGYEKSCEGTVASLTVSKVSPAWRSRTAWSLLIVYRKKSKPGKPSERQICWIEAQRVGGRLVWIVRGGPAPELKMELGKQRWERRGRCLLAVLEAEHEDPNGNSESQRFYYTLGMPKQVPSLSYLELINESHQGVHPTQKSSTFKWKRVGKHQYLIHRTVTTERGGAYGQKIISRKVAVAVHRMDASCLIEERSRAQIKKLRRKRRGRTIPLPKSD